TSSDSVFGTNKKIYEIIFFYTPRERYGDEKVEYPFTGFVPHALLPLAPCPMPHAPCSLS
ncbi:MAG: hypothetical protein Q7J86_13170, partial [Bacteroidota bacterium]|nr:hypothetical protein [Bacteroidota bacterium]